MRARQTRLIAQRKRPIPVTEAEVEVFEQWFGEPWDE